MPASFSAVLLVAAASAQTTHVVGPGGFPQVANALAVAAPGDVIQVLAGGYQGFTTTIGVTIVGTGTQAVFFPSITANLPPGQTLHLADLTSFALAITTSRATADNIRVIDLCTVTSGELHARGCSFGNTSTSTAPEYGLKASGSTITAIDSSFDGKSSTSGPAGYAFNSPALRLTTSTFHGSRLTIRGGNDTSSFPNVASPAVNASSSKLWISDSTLRCGRTWGGTMPLYPDPCAIVGSGNVGRLVRCSLVTGATSCTLIVPLSGPLLGVQQPTALQSPGPFTLTYQTSPNELIGVFVSFGIDNLVIPGLEQPLLLQPSGLFALDTLLADGLGAASGTWNMPAGLTNQTVFFQAVGTAPAPALLQMSPVAGGVVR